MSEALRAATADNGFVFHRDGTETPGQKYQRVRSAILHMLSSSDPKHKAIVKQQNAGLLKLKEVGPGQVQDNRFLANLSVQYKNDEYIGESLFPELQTPALAGEFPKYDKRSRLAAPDDSMAGRSVPNEISDSRSTGTYACQGYALQNFVTAITLRNQQAPLDEMVDLTEATAEMIALRRELRIAAVATNTSNYDSSTQVSLTSGTYWDSATGGNPVANIQQMIASLWSGRGPTEIVGACSIDVWNVLSRHPAILDLFKYGGTAPGLATPDMIAKFFGIDKMLVSRARQDTANEGQTASYSRIWGKAFVIMRVAKRASIRNASFGNTFRFGPQKTLVWFDPKTSTEGAYYAKVSTHEQHNVIANDTGAIIGQAIS